MDKYIMPKLTGFDGKRYLNIDFNSENIRNALAIRFGNYLFIQMGVNIGTDGRKDLTNFIRDTSIIKSEQYYIAPAVKATGNGSPTSIAVAQYSANENVLSVRSSSSSTTQWIYFNILLPIEEGY